MGTAPPSEWPLTSSAPTQDDGTAPTHDRVVPAKDGLVPEHRSGWDAQRARRLRAEAVHRRAARPGPGRQRDPRLLEVLRAFASGRVTPSIRPCFACKHPKVAQKEVETYSTEQIERIFAATPPGWPTMAVKVLIGTGMRLSELCCLTLEDSRRRRGFVRTVPTDPSEVGLWRPSPPFPSHLRHRVPEPGRRNR